MRVMWDLDDAICATTESAMRFFHSQGKLLAYGTQHVLSYWWECLPVERCEVASAYERRDVLYQADHYPDAIRAINRIKELDARNEQFIVSARPVSIDTPRLTRQWLHVRNLDLPLYFVSAEQKPQWCIDNGIDFAFEDNLDTAIALAERGIGACLVDQPWNKTTWNTHKCAKLSALSDVSRHMRREKHEKLTQYVEIAYNNPSSLHRSLLEIMLEESLRSSMRGRRYW